MNEKEVKNLLDKYNLRKTIGMKKILHVFLENKKPITAEDIHLKIKKDVDQSTVYRTITRFLEKNVIQEVFLSAEKKFYELASRHHHHHLVCTECEVIVDIPCIQEIVKKINPKDYNFETIDNHSFELFGKCKKCK